MAAVDRPWCALVASRLPRSLAAADSMPPPPLRRLALPAYLALAFPKVWRLTRLTLRLTRNGWLTPADTLIPFVNLRSLFANLRSLATLPPPSFLSTLKEFLYRTAPVR